MGLADFNTVLTETFDRPDSSTVGNGWELPSGGGTSNHAIVGNRLRCTSSSFVSGHIFRPDSEKLEDCEVLFDFAGSGLANAPEAMVRAEFSTSATGYFCFFSADTAYMCRLAGGAWGDTLHSQGYSIGVLSTSGNYRAAFSAITNGSQVDLLLKVYDLGNSNNQILTFSWSDTSAGRIVAKGRQSLGGNGGTNYYDNFVVRSGDVAVPTKLTITVPPRGVASAPTIATRTYVDTTINVTIPYTRSCPIGSTVASVPVEAAVPPALLPSGGGVKFVLNEGTSGEVSHTVTGGAGPFSYTFTNVPRGYHTLNAYTVNSSGVVQTGTDNHDFADSIGVGHIIAVLGDSHNAGESGSVTGSIHNWTEAASGDVSVDHRQFPLEDKNSGVWRKSYMVELSDVMSAALGFPCLFLNEAGGGWETTHLLTLLDDANFQARMTDMAPNIFLVEIGINDATMGRTKADYKANVSTILSRLKSDYGATSNTIYLATPGWAGAGRQAWESQYCEADAELVAAGSAKAGADCNSLYLNNQSLLDGTYHPTAAGYTAKKDLWFPILVPMEATGTATSAPGSASGSASQAIPASGTGAAAVGGASGLGGQPGPIAASGTGAGSPGAASGAGAPVLAGTGTGSAASGASTGAAAPSIAGTGTGAGTAGGASGAGIEVLPGAGTGAAGSGSATGAAAERVAASGAAAATPGTASGSAAEAVAGAGTGAAGPGGATGTGIEVLPSYGTGTAGPGGATGVAAEKVAGAGTGAAGLGAGTGAGSMDMAAEGTGAASQAGAGGFASSGDPAMYATGTGAAVSGGAAGQASMKLPGEGAGFGTQASASGAADVTLLGTGTGAGTMGGAYGSAAVGDPPIYVTGGGAAAPGEASGIGRLLIFASGMGAALPGAAYGRAYSGTTEAAPIVVLVFSGKPDEPLTYAGAPDVGLSFT